MYAMLDFTTPIPVSHKDRFRARARVARKLARVTTIALAGLVGAALISEPSIFGSARTAFGTVLDHAQDQIETSRFGARDTALLTLEEGLSGTTPLRP